VAVYGAYTIGRVAGVDLLPAVHRLDARSYGRIVESGALDDQRLELLDGLLTETSPNSPRHAALVQHLTHHLAGARERYLRVQLPLEVAEDSVPEPDLALVGEPSSPAAHPRTADLVVEVTVTSSTLDRGRKAELYATAGVVEYWVVDVPRAVVEIHRHPASGGYRQVEAYRAGDVLPSPVPGVAGLAVANLLADVI
jgi:Uma2 family endonuclease